MSKKKLTGKHLKTIGYDNDQIISLTINIIEKELKKAEIENKIDLAERIFKNPEKFLENTIFKPVALGLLKQTGDVFFDDSSVKKFDLLTKGVDYKIYGVEDIEPGAIHQMETAMKLPITVAGALMADAHEGYGLPIGGVLATQSAVIPYAVGVDIGCRMALSIFEVPENYLDRYHSNLKKILIDNTKFGQKQEHDKIYEVEVLERKEFSEIEILKKGHQNAYKQLGTSGSGNHFVEFGDVEILHENNILNIPKGKYLGLLTHSGSRHLGYEIAGYYTKIAADKCRLPSGAKHLAWLDLHSNEGLEYWKAMTIAGDYAKANHDFIHNLISKVLKEKAVAKVENHHNFAWKEKQPDGNEVIVHRKGATPAFEGMLGLIPGSMATPAFIVSGKGNPLSLSSASHGAGRLMSRSQAKNTFTKKHLKQFLEKANVELIGGDLDEVPMAYKDIHKVMAAQKDLVNIIGTFMPRIVRMDG